MINLSSLTLHAQEFASSEPFPHCIIDSFFTENLAIDLARQFPDFESDIWHEYCNEIEVKKACNNWNLFPKETYQTLNYLLSTEFLELLGEIVGIKKLLPDPGLNGGGWHIHKTGGKLNQHLDYSIHPKLGKQRILNLIVYLNPDWEEGWGGEFGLWCPGCDPKRPGSLFKKVTPIFNRGVIFETTGSWHGLATPVAAPEGQCRKSLAVYYLIEPLKDASNRGKAQFAPTKEQESDAKVLDLIEKRATVDGAMEVWKSD